MNQNELDLETASEYLRKNLNTFQLAPFVLSII